MAGKNLDYWYDEQIKRYLLQIIRIFQDSQTREYTKNGVKYNRVPARYGDMSRMVASIMRKNSENIINSAPFISVSIQSLQLLEIEHMNHFLLILHRLQKENLIKKHNHMVAIKVTYTLLKDTCLFHII